MAEPELIELAAPPASIKKLLSCMSSLGLNPSVYNGGPDSVLVFGKRDDLRLAVQARYTVGVSPTGKPSAKFAGAKVHDPVGIVANLEANYYYGPQQIKQQHMLPSQAEKVGQERSAKYNDGAQWRKTIADLDTAAALNEWLDDYICLLKVDHKKQSAIKKQKPTDMDLMQGADWVE